MGRSRNDIEAIVKRVRVFAASNQTRNMGHIGHKENFVLRFLLDFITDFGDAFEIR